MRSWFWRFSAVFFSVLAGLAGPVAAEPSLLTPLQFRDAYLEVVQKLAPGIQVRVESETDVVLEGASGAEARVFLGNAYEEYRRAPKALDDLLFRQAKIALKAVGPETGIAKAKTIVVVRSVAFRDGYEQAAVGANAANRGYHLLSRSLPGDLAAVVVSDEGDSFRYPAEAEFVEVFGSADSAWRTALANTPARIAAPRIEPLGLTIAISADDGLATSLLLFDEFWVDFAREHPGRSVVFVAAKDLLLVAMAEDPGAMEQLAAMARDAHDNPDKFGEPLTADFLARGADGWVVFATYPYE